MRYLICIAIGLLAGFLFATMLANTLQRRSAWPRGLMHVMKHDLETARHTAHGTQCATPEMAQRASRLRLMAAQLGPALLPPDQRDRVLAQYIQQFSAETEHWNPAADCPTQAAALTSIANACEACHRDYR